MMKVYFCSNADQFRKAEEDGVYIYPSPDKWNNFGYRFATLWSIRLKKEVHHLEGSQFTYFADEHDTELYLKKIIQERGSIQPQSIRRSFVSLLSDIQHYKQLISILGLRNTNTVLQLTNDAVWLGLYHSDNKKLLELTASQMFHLGALRSSSAYFAFRRAGGLLRRSDRSSDSESGAFTGSFTLQFKIPGFKNEHKIDFGFMPADVFPHRINVLIGKNGAGKSQSFVSLTTGLIDYARSKVGGTAKITPRPELNKVLLFSAVTDDPYLKEVSPEHALDYRYFNVIAHQASMFELTELLKDIYRSVDLVEDKSRLELLEEICGDSINLTDLHLPLREDFHVSSAVEVDGVQYFPYLKMHTGGEQRSMLLQNSIDTTREPKFISRRQPYPLSSGQMAYFRFAVQALSFIDTGSLVLFDEPETHLHPNLITSMMDLLAALLDQTQSYAIIATHSAYVVREVSKNYIHVLSVTDREAQVSKPYLQTFGATIDHISNFIFQDAEFHQKRFEKILERLIEGEDISTPKQLLKRFGGSLAPENMMFLRAKLFADKQ